MRRQLPTHLPYKGGDGSRTKNKIYSLSPSNQDWPCTHNLKVMLYGLIFKNDSQNTYLLWFPHVRKRRVYNISKKKRSSPGSATHGTLEDTGKWTWPASPGTCLATSDGFGKTSARKIVKTNHKSVEVLYLPVLSIQRVQLGLLAVLQFFQFFHFFLDVLHGCFRSHVFQFSTFQWSEKAR